MRVGLIGAGPWGKIYIKTLLRDFPGALRAIYSGNPDTPRLVPAEVRVTHDLETFWSQLDSVIIASPHTSHRELCLQAIAKKIPLLVEKPFTLSVTDAITIQSALENSPIPVRVGHLHLHSPA